MDDIKEWFINKLGKDVTELIYKEVECQYCKNGVGEGNTMRTFMTRPVCIYCWDIINRYHEIHHILDEIQKIKDMIAYIIGMYSLLGENEKRKGE